MGYLAQSDVESRLGTTLTDEQVSYFNEVLSPAIDAYLNEATYTVFNNSEETDVYVSGSDSNLLTIPTMSDISAVYSITEDGTETAVSPTAYTEYPRGKSYIYAIRNKQGTWEEGFDNYRVVGKLGYADVPGNIKAIAVEMAVSSINSNVNGYKSERVGDWSVTYGDSSIQSPISADSMKVLLDYRRLSRSV